MDAMGTTTSSLMTFQEFEQLPDEPRKLELLKGELIRMPPPKKKHMLSTERLFKLLDRIAEDLSRKHPELGLGEVHMEMGYRMGSDPESWLIPDVSITHIGQAGDEYYEGAPLIAIEVASESQSAAYLEAKAQTYLANGALEVWLLYPKTRHVWICHAGKTTVDLQEQAIRSELLPEIDIRFDDIF